LVEYSHIIWAVRMYSNAKNHGKLASLVVMCSAYAQIRAQTDVCRAAVLAGSPVPSIPAVELRDRHTIMKPYPDGDPPWAEYFGLHCTLYMHSKAFSQWWMDGCLIGS